MAGVFYFRLKQYLHFYIQRKARNNRSFHNDGMMMEMISETENTTQQHGPDKHQAYPEQHRECNQYFIMPMKEV